MKTLLVLGLILVSNLGLACALERGNSASSTSSSSSSTGSTSVASKASARGIARNIGASTSAFSEATGNPFASVGNEGREPAAEGLRKPGSSRRNAVQ